MLLKKLYIVCILLVLFENDNTKLFKLAVSTPKDAYKIGEAIPIYLQILNISNKPIYIDGRLDICAKFDITIYLDNKEVKYQKYGCTLKPIEKDEYIKLWPKQFFGIVWYMNQKYYNIDTVGNYTINVTYTTGRGRGENLRGDAFTGTLYSEPIKIRIVE